MENPKFNKDVTYGERIVPELIDEIAATNPERLAGMIAKSSDIKQGFRRVTFREISNAINYMAWWLDEHIGRNGRIKTISYMGVTDFRYLVMTAAAIKCGHTLFLPSLRNSLFNNLHIFEEVGCDVLFHTPELDEVAGELSTKRRSLHHFVVPSFDQMVRSISRKYLYTKSWKDARLDKVLVVHSSGSTGPPKPTYYTNEYLGTVDSQRKIPLREGKRPSGISLLEGNSSGSFYYSSLPPFHTGGVYFGLGAIFYDIAIVLGPPGGFPTAKIVIDILRQVKLRTLISAPSIYDDILKDYKEEYLQYGDGIEMIQCGGGPLASAAGDFFAKTAAKVVHYWQYHEWHEDIAGIVMEPVDTDSEVCELVIHRRRDQAWMQPVFMAFPHLDHWRSKDLFRKHPTRPLWLYEGRIDDIIVLSNGEKFNPVTVEGIIQSHPLVVGALITSISVTELIDQVWPVVEQANRDVPGHAKIHKTMIMATEPDRPLVRAAKGTVIRSTSTKLYKAEIERLYDQPRAGDHRSMNIPRLKIPKQTIAQFIQDVVNIHVGKSVSETDDLFTFAIDSLQTIELAKTIRMGMKPFLQPSDVDRLSAKMIYENPTVEKLSSDIYSLMNREHICPEKPADQKQLGPAPYIVQQMKELLEKYTADLPLEVPKNVKEQHGKVNVVLTGSTGFLGHYILEDLLRDSRVGTITCFNRGADGEERFKAKLSKTRDLDLGSRNSQFMQVRYDQPLFGLPKTAYNTLLEEVDVVIHNAWKVNFNHSLKSYDNSHLRGIRSFVDWSLSSPRNMRICFVSSISSVGNWGRSYSTEPIPEAAVDDYALASDLGYGQSKHVAERILTVAAQERDIPITIFRVGQIAGPLKDPRDVWSRSEWFPSLLKTSKALGAIPATLGAMDSIDWIPVDSLAPIITELSLPSPSSSKVEVFNLVNPETSSYTTLLSSTIQGQLDDPVVKSLEDWLDELRKISRDVQPDFVRYPALKILSFFEGLSQSSQLTFETGKCKARSEEMLKLKAVDQGAMETWLGQWSF